MRKSFPFIVVVALAACGGGGTETLEVTQTVHVTTTVEAPPPTTSEGTTTGAPAGTDPDDVSGSLDIRDFKASQGNGLITVTLSTYEAWVSSVLAGDPLSPGPNTMTVLYDVDIDGKTDYRAKLVFAGGRLPRRVYREVHTPRGHLHKASAERRPPAPWANGLRGQRRPSA
jgi:hypothetical protein